jgi:hypothetical protein
MKIRPDFIRKQLGSAVIVCVPVLRGAKAPRRITSWASVTARPRSAFGHLRRFMPRWTANSPTANTAMASSA